MDSRCPEKPVQVQQSVGRAEKLEGMTIVEDEGEVLEQVSITVETEEMPERAHRPPRSATVQARV